MPPLHSLFSMGQLTADPQLQDSIGTQESPGALVCRINFNKTMNSLESSLGSRSLANIVYSEPRQLGLTPFCKRTRRAQRHKDPAFQCPQGRSTERNKTPASSGRCDSRTFQRTQINESSHTFLKGIWFLLTKQSSPCDLKKKKKKKISSSSWPVLRF